MEKRVLVLVCTGGRGGGIGVYVGTPGWPAARRRAGGEGGGGAPRGLSMAKLSLVGAAASGPEGADDSTPGRPPFGCPVPLPSSVPATALASLAPTYGLDA